MRGRLSSELTNCWDWKLRRNNFDRMFPRLNGQEYAAGPMLASDHLAHLMNLPLSDICRSGRLLAEGLLKAADLYGTDFTIVFSDVSVETEAMGVEMQFFPDGNPQPVKHLPLSAIKPVKLPGKGRLPELFNAAEIIRREKGEDYTIFFSTKDALSLAAMTLGTEEFLMSLALEPEQAAEALEICCEALESLVREICREGYIPMIGAPIASGDLIGGKYFSRFAAPWLGRLFEIAREEGSFACTHICGSVGNLLEPLSHIQPDVLSMEDYAAAVNFKMFLPETMLMGVWVVTLSTTANLALCSTGTLACATPLGIRPRQECLGYIVGRCCL